ncbi:ScyD/ScyE family protein [Catenuloplanes atrovinosus]|uniref:ScyD/ScyE family protein n=1 Tax=Catenuloplanes atrovinosus TaxID=137266 RepID=A0AAE3YN17_9ACTN|nr:ScyD/ScyE family protein [Catenuloplanes atrovinosus]MDR7276799.1 hypothetical protein [Catenuloplanes atrovinosus]
MLTWTQRAGLLVAPVLALTALAPGGAVAGTTGTGGGPRVVADGLVNPRGLTFGPDGTLYVAEAGAGGAGPCIPGPYESQLCLGDTGAVTAITRGTQRRVLTGLPSLRSDGEGLSTYGPHDVAFDPYGRLNVAIGYSTNPENRAQLGPAGAALGTVVQAGPRGSWRVTGDVTAYELAHNPAGGPLESQPYGLYAGARTSYVADAAGNTLFSVDRSGRVELVAVFPEEQVPAPPEWGLPPGATVPADAVPVAVTRGPDGALYVGQLTGHPFPRGGAKVWRIVPGQAPTVYQTGFTNIIDLTFDRRGRLVVLEIARYGLDSADLTGALWRVERDGTRTELASAGLTTPMSVAQGPDGAFYVSNDGLAAGEVVRVPASG